MGCLKQSTILEVVLYDHIGNCVENKLNISGICSTGEVGVDLLQMTLRVTASEKVKMKSCHS